MLEELSGKRVEDNYSLIIVDRIEEREALSKMFKFLSPSKKRTKDEIERELEGLKKDIKVEKKALQGKLQSHSASSTQYITL